MPKNRIKFSDNFVLDNDKIGINTSSPQALLDVNGDVKVSGIVTSQSLNVTGNANFGRIGVGTDPSSSALDIIGNGKFTGIVTASQFSTGSVGNAINIHNSSITGPGEILIDPAPVGTNSGAVRVKGDLYIDGTTTSLNSVEIKDFKVSVASSVSSDFILDGAGIGIGSTNIRKTFVWEYATSSLKSSENINLGIGKTYKINGVDVLSSTTLGSGVVNSSLTSVGTLNQLSVAGVVTASSFAGVGSSITALNASNLTSGIVPAARITASGGDFAVGNNLFVNGTLSVGGTSVILSAATLVVKDKDIVVGYATDINGNDISSDNTANHGGISVASTVGSPIINIPLQVGVNSTPSTYKQFMWIKQGNYSGMGTDAWVSNYAISIGNTASVQNGSRLTVGAGFTVYDTYLDASSIDIYGKVVNAKGVSVQGNVTPTANNTYDLGSNSLRWNNVYVNQISASTITGTLSGAASSLTITPDNQNTSRYFVLSSATSGITSALVDADIVFNPSTASLGIGTTNPVSTLTVNAPSGYGGNVLDLRLNNYQSAWVVPAVQGSTDAALWINGRSGSAAQYRNDGITYTSGAWSSISLGGGTGSSTNGIFMGVGGVAGFQIGSDIPFSFGNDVKLARDSANVFAQRNAGLGQTFRIYNTYTSGSQYERAYLGWNNNVFQIGVDTAGISTARQMEFQTNGITRVSISTTGFVGINTTSPIQPFQVGAVGTNIVVVDDIGEIGLGITNPTAKIHVIPTSNQIAGLFSGTTSNDMVRITQLGTGNAIVVEDSANPDTSPFVVTAAGDVGIGTTNPLGKLDVAGVLNVGSVTQSGTQILNIKQRGDSDGIRLYSGNNSNGGSVNPPYISFYRSIGESLSANPRFRIQGYSAGWIGSSSDFDGFSLSSPNSSTDWIGGSPNATGSGTATVATGSGISLLVKSGDVSIGDEPAANSTPSDGTIRSAQKYSGTNVKASNFIIQAGRGTGDSSDGGGDVKGNIFFQTPQLTTSGSTVQPYQTKLTIGRTLTYFQNSPVLVGTATSTGTASQTLQVTGGAYVSGNVGVGTTNPQYKLHVVGDFGATTKSFVIPHPTKPGMTLRHGSLEGAENGVYVRGKTTESIIPLPDYWTGLVDEESITVNLTPKNGKLHSVVGISSNTVEVECIGGEIDCYFMILGERKDVAKLVAEY